jgi:hypothetical protein
MKRSIHRRQPWILCEPAAWIVAAKLCRLDDMSPARILVKAFLRRLNIENLIEDLATAGFGEYHVAFGEIGGGTNLKSQRSDG